MSDTHDTSDDERTDPNVTLPREGLAARRSTLPPVRARPPSLPARPRLTPPPLPRAGTLPPASLPRPSDPPRAEPSAAQRQRLAQLETQLDQARAAIERLDHALRTAREQAEQVGARVETLAAARDEAPALEPRLIALEARSAALEASLRGLEDASVDPREAEARVASLAERVRVLEEGEGEARIRMRLERATHRLDDLDRRLAALEAAQPATAEALTGAAEREAGRDARLARLESLFEELADEVRVEHDALDLDGVRARLDDVETLVLSAGSGEATLRRQLDEHARTLESLRESIVPEPAGDDLTRIKGIGPKYARLLREAGTTTFAQIAAWTGEDVARAADALGIPASRITKAGWIEAAAKLAR